MNNGIHLEADEFQFFIDPVPQGHIYQASSEDSTPELRQQQDQITLIEPSELRSKLLMIESFVNGVLASDKPGFIWTGNKPRYGIAIPTTLGKRYFRLLSRPLDLPQREHLFSEQVELFLSCAREIGFPPCDQGPPNLLVPVSAAVDATGSSLEARPNQRLGDVFNALIDKIRYEGRTEAFRKKLQYRQTKAKRQSRSASGYVDRLFEVCSRLLVMRIDLEYPVAMAHEVTLSQARADLKHLFDNKRSNRLFDPLLGYIWKLEDGIKRGLHFHVVLFFDGSRSRQDRHLAEKIGRYWTDRITQGRGNYHNCNRDKGTYRYCGIGMISHDDVVKRQNLMNRVIHYFVKTEQHLKLKGGRVFGRGELPKREGTKLGRRRRSLSTGAGTMIAADASSDSVAQAQTAHLDW